ncbi:hypothetical protein BJ170DRAFT_630546 [Xylariales sp. AK1849]|nr:hypothetical protein BJ170DRAFT_630546 [Xylariales sp. AK1849]
MMESKTSRYQSRILREMHQSNENPFNSPPSSTGSHGTVTLTSDLSYGPEGESTRRMEDSVMLPGLPNRQATGDAHPTPFKINTSAIGRNFPEWTRWNANSREQTTDIYNVTGDRDYQAKENIPPSSSTVASPSQIKTQKVSQGTFGTRAHMQASVEDESDFSGNMYPSPSARQQKTKPQTSWKPQRGNVTSLIQTLKAAQAAKESTPRKSSPQPHASERRSSAGRMQNSRHSRISDIHMSPATPNQTARSFFLPNLVHINDFVSGVLRLSSVKDGIPVFVKHGKVHDRESKSSPESHVELDAIEVPRDEQEIFVSLNKIREEIHTLQAHDDQVSKQAEQLQEEIYELQVQISKLKSRKDSATGSDSESSMVDYLNAQKSQLEEKVTTIQSKLDKANRKISINEIHTESYVAERDEALKSATEHLEKIDRLQTELDATRKQLNAAHGGKYEINVIEDENKSLREDNITIRSQYKALLEENRSLRSHNTAVTEQNTKLQQEVKHAQRLFDSAKEDRDLLQNEYEVITEEKRTIREDNLSLERHNDKFYNDNKSLQQKVSLLERRVHDLQDNNSQLHQMIDVANAEAGTTTLDIKDIKDRLGKRNGNLSEENAQLQQQIIDMQEDFTSKRIAFEQEKRRLAATNEDLHGQLDHMSKQFEQIIQQSRDQVAKYATEKASLERQLDETVQREATLAIQLEDSAEKESIVQQHAQRRHEAIQEARRISKEIHELQTTANMKTKPVKVTRIVEPTTSKSRSTFSEMSGRTTASQTDMQREDDYTREFNLTQGSDFNILPEAEMDKLREALRRARADFTQQNVTEEYLDDGVEAGIEDDASQSLPLPFIPRTVRTDISNKTESTMAKRQPSGILKNPPRRLPEQDTGRFSVKSAMSGMSMPGQATGSDIFHGRRHSDSARFDLDVEENMTSALFMDDITLDARKRAAEKENEKEPTKTKKTIPTLSKEAKRVLDSLCHDHDCRNCIVCTRINSHKHEDVTGKEDAVKKKTIIVEKPIPVTDRIPNPVLNTDAESDYEDQPTTRPATDPGRALATVLKSLRDEVAHLKTAVAKKQAVYNGLDASFGRRQRKQVSSELNRLLRMLELKNEQIYKLYDVLEGQKRNGQQMGTMEVEMTLMSIRTAEDTWDGIMD